MTAQRIINNKRKKQLERMEAKLDTILELLAKPKVKRKPKAKPKTIAEVNVAAEESWKDNEDGYRYLAEEKHEKITRQTTAENDKARSQSIEVQ